MTVVPEGEDAIDLPSLDPAALERLKRFGGGKLLGEMIRLFLTAAPERITAARVAVDANDAPALELALHSLKSSSAQLGAMRMQRLCAQGEQDARDGNLAAVRPVVGDLEQEFTRVQEWLTSFAEGGKA